MEFLTEAGALKKIRTLFEESDKVRVAVAFWGKGAMENLGLDREGIDAEILCNLESGSCNPAELRAMSKRYGSQVRTNPNLHAKVYWTPNGVCLGSSNASTNGLAAEDYSSRSWREANIFSSDPALIKDIEQWFDRLYDDPTNRVVSSALINEIEELWKERRRLSPKVGVNKTLIASYRENSGHQVWNDVRILVYEEGISEAGISEQAEAKKEGIVPEDFDCYENWGDVFNPGEHLLEFHLSGNEIEWSQIAHVIGVKTETLQHVQVKKRLDLAPHYKLSVPSTDKALLASAVQSLLSSELGSTRTESIHRLIPISVVMDELVRMEKAEG